jgi:hypothetical protein
MAAGVALEMLGVLGRQESALMMVEPPGQPRVGGVLEIHDGIDVAVEISGLEKLVGFVGQAGESEFGRGIKFGFDKAAEKRRRGRAVETMIVI